MTTINFTKMNGAGNDFILIDSRKNVAFQLSEELIKQICDRRKGIGADGILFLEPSNLHDFKLTYYNSDGSLGSLCGNGSRCSLKYAAQNFEVDTTDIKFECNGNSYSGSVEKNNVVTFNLKSPSEIRMNFPIIYKQKPLITHFVNSGSPHSVIFWEEIGDNNLKSFMKFNMFEFGKIIRNSVEFSPKGTNVNLIHLEKDNIYIRTYERGVEDETLACGTGAVASAIILKLVKKINLPIILNTFGNDKLEVNFIIVAEKFKKITLTGPAKINYIGSYNF
ncbi:MAG: diaminopimelate epimerase [Melioribacteraceae bacterium]|nr:diaminopimelate epimerase [Melioribacteraceae bacterium]